MTNFELNKVKHFCQHFNRQSDYGVEVTRLLERCIKESKCLDTESLCIMAGIKVWSTCIIFKSLDLNTIYYGSLKVISLHVAIKDNGSNESHG